MSDILRDFSNRALVGAIWANMAEWYRFLGGSPMSKLYDEPDLGWFTTARIPHTFFRVKSRFSHRISFEAA